MRTRDGSLSIGGVPLSTTVEWTQHTSTIAVFVLFHAVTGALCFYLLRRQIEDGVSSILTALVSMAALIACVLLALRVARHLNARADIALALGALAGYLLPLAGLEVGPWGLSLTSPVAGLGILLIARDTHRQAIWGRAIFVMLAGVASGFAMLLALNGLDYAHLFSYEFTAFGWQAGDTVFHAAIAALFRQYHVPTVGLDGTPLIFYHVGSHVLISALSETAKENTLLAYPAAQQIFFVPALLFGSAVAAAAVVGPSRNSGWAAALATVLAWNLYEWFGAYNSFLLSESYAVSLGLLSFAVPAMLAGPGRGVGALVGWCAMFLVAPFSVAAKFTVAFAWVLLAAIGLANQMRRSNMPAVRLALTTVAVMMYFLMLVGLASQLGTGKSNGIFAYAKTYPRPYEVSIGAALVGIAALTWLRRRNPSAPSSLLLLALALLLHLPDVYLNDGAGGAYYWFHPADHVAMIASVAAIIVALDTWMCRSRASLMGCASVIVVTTAYLTYSAQGFVPQTIAFANTLVALDRVAAAEALPKLGPPGGGRSHEYVRKFFAPDRPEPWSARDGASFLQSVRIVLGRLAAGIDRRLASIVAETPMVASATSTRLVAASGAGQHPGVFIEPNASWKWQSQRDCVAGRFAFQALSNLALIAGVPVPNATCPAIAGFGTGGYDDRSLNRPLDDGGLCAAAKERALAPVVRLSGEGVPVLIRCGAVSKSAD